MDAAMLPGCAWNSYDCENCLCEEYLFFSGLGALLRPETILEVGTELGLGLAALYTGARQPVLEDGKSVWKAPRVTTIDQELDMVGVRQTLAACKIPEEDIEFIKGDSMEVLPQLVQKKRWFDLVLMDGSHEEPFVSSDWEFVSRLSHFFILHDSTQKPAVGQLVQGLHTVPEYEVFEFNAYRFGTVYDRTGGDRIAKRGIPGITLVRRRRSFGVKDSAALLGGVEAAYLSEVGYPRSRSS